MAEQLRFDGLVGTWKGTNVLWMEPEGPGDASSATARVALVAGGGFTSFAYTWSYEEKPQDGVLLVRHGTRPGPLDAVWVDSFHTNGAFQTFRGELDASRRWSFHGTYPVHDGPAWGWRIAIEAGDGAWFLRMWNVPPGGAEARAVEARFHPA